jgi:RNA polymerase sigma-70 factor (ECF subfamily)
VLEPLDDAALVTQAKTDSEAFGQLYERYVKKIYNYLYYRTGDVHEAEDLTARVFYRALVHLNRYTDRGLPFSAWLYRIAHNLAANWHRDHGRRVILPLHAIAPGDWDNLHAEAPDLMVETKEAQDRLRRAIQGLPAERQQVLLLKFVERMSNSEIGVVMQRSEGAVKSLYHRTLLALRDELTRLDAATQPPIIPEIETPRT